MSLRPASCAFTVWHAGQLQSGAVAPLLLAELGITELQLVATVTQLAVDTG
jgi:hypothetical protein